MPLKHRPIVFLLAAIVPFSSGAASPALMTLADNALQQRWNQQADLYEKNYRLIGCSSTRTPAPDRTIMVCHTAGNAGVVTFQRKAGQLDRIQYMPQGNPAINASMFFRFVRGTSVGDMAAVGTELLRKAQRDGDGCVQEASAQVCAAYASGEFFMEATQR